MKAAEKSLTINDTSLPDPRASGCSADPAHACSVTSTLWIQKQWTSVVYQTVMLEIVPALKVSYCYTVIIVTVNQIAVIHLVNHLVNQGGHFRANLLSVPLLYPPHSVPPMWSHPISEKCPRKISLFPSPGSLSTYSAFIFPRPLQRFLDLG